MLHEEADAEDLSSGDPSTSDPDYVPDMEAMSDFDIGEPLEIAEQAEELFPEDDWFDDGVEAEAEALGMGQQGAERGLPRAGAGPSRGRGRGRGGPGLAGAPSARGGGWGAGAGGRGCGLTTR